jgi:hypothetical protein
MMNLTKEIGLIHTGEPVTSGTKYTMRTELLYKCSDLEQ